MLVLDRTRTRPRGGLHSSMMPPTPARTAARQLFWSHLQALTDRSGSNAFLNPLPNRAENFPKHAAQTHTKCLLCANHPVRQQECKEKVSSFKELALMGNRDNYKEVGVVTQVSPRDQRGGEGRLPRGMMSPKLGPRGSRTMSQAKK